MIESAAIWLIISGMICLTMAGVVWTRRSAPGAQPLVVSMLAMTAWDWCYALMILDPVQAHQLFWMTGLLLAVMVLVPASFISNMQFAGRANLVTGRARAGLVVMPLLSMSIFFVPALRPLFIDIVPDALGATAQPGPWMYFFIAYGNVLFWWGYAALYSARRSASGLYRRQLTLVMLGIIFPALGSIVSAVTMGAATKNWLDLVPISFGISAGILAYGRFTQGLMDLVPVSRDALVENLEDGILVMDLQGRIVDANPRALALIGLSESPVGHSIESVFARWGNSVERFDLMRGRFQVFQEHGPFHWLDVRIIPIHDGWGTALGHIASLRDISLEVQAADKTRVFLYVVDQNPAAIYITNLEGHIEYVNNKLVELSGYPALEIMGNTPRLFKSGETADEIYSQMWTTILSGEIWEGDLLNRRKNGELYWVHELVAPVKDESGAITHFIATDQDITDRKHTDAELRVANTRLQFQLTQIENLHQQLREESIRDGLTRLFNRRYMEETLEREIQMAQRHPMPISVAMMDVDLFKSINDSFGHQAGDTVLQTLGTLLIENTRASDVACRYGGDEMVVVLSGASSADALARAEEWRKAFSRLEITFGLQGVKTTLSLGVATYPEHGRTPTELLGAADRALYVAKARRNSASVYVPESLTASETHKIDI